MVNNVPMITNKIRKSRTFGPKFDRSKSKSKTLSFRNEVEDIFSDSASVQTFNTPRVKL